MSGKKVPHPVDDSWVVAVYGAPKGSEPLGTAVLIDDRRALTCAHFLREHKAEVWIAFPKAPGRASRKRRKVLPCSYDELDVAVLTFDEPLPDGVTPAPLRCPAPNHLIKLRWWAFGFPAPYTAGNSADGLVGEALATGVIRLDTRSRYGAAAGFSGAGLWCDDYRAVVAIVSHSSPQRGDGQAITLHEIDCCLPELNLRRLAGKWSIGDAGDVALAAWEMKQGHRFWGRSEALARIRGWLDQEHPDRRVLVVTGRPGSGKSAVLGRIIADAAHGSGAGGPRGSVACAVYAQGKTALKVAAEMAQAASAKLPERARDFGPSLHWAPATRSGRRFNVIIDALDKATSSAEARTIIKDIILPMAGRYADDVRVIVGSRRSDEDGDLLAAFGQAVEVIDLDEPPFFVAGDLIDYARATLRQSGEMPGADPHAYDAAAREIARQADRNFLFAGLIARMYGQRDELAGLSSAHRTSSALSDYILRDLGAVEGIPAMDALTALAFAETPGLPVGLWRAALRALGLGDVSTGKLGRFARSAAGNFLAEGTGPQHERVFRLFHQCLNDALRDSRTHPEDDERALTLAFIAAGQAGWARAPAYLRHSLATHANRAGMLDDLLADSVYLLYADLTRLLSLADSVTSVDGQRRVRLIRMTPGAIAADPSTRAALFSVTDALENLGSAYTSLSFPAPYRAAWAAVAPQPEQTVLEGHAGKILSVCDFIHKDMTLLASGGTDRTIRIWDPVTGSQQAELRGHTGAVVSLCAFSQGDDVWLASGGTDRTIRIWDPASPTAIRVLRGHARQVSSLCAFTLDDRTLLASCGSADQTIRIWDPATGASLRVLDVPGWPRAVCAFARKGRACLAIGDAAGTVQIWEPGTPGEPLAIGHHASAVTVVRAISDDGRTLLASGAEDGIRIWHPGPGGGRPPVRQSAGEVRSLCLYTRHGLPRLVAGGPDGTLRLWDLATSADRPTVHWSADAAISLCSFTLQDRVLLAGGCDGRLRIWDPEGTSGLWLAPRPADSTRSLSVCTRADGTVLASGGGDGTLRTWDPATGASRWTMKGHKGSAGCVCAFTSGGDTLLASGGDDGALRVWNLADGTERAAWPGQAGPIRALCAFTRRDRSLLVRGGADGTLRICDPDAPDRGRPWMAHPGGVSSVCAFAHDGEILLASTGATDRSVRIWSSADHAELTRLTSRTGWGSAVCAWTHYDDTLVAVGNTDGTLRIWDLAARRERAAFEAHANRVRALAAFTHDGKTLLASGGDRLVRIWHPDRARSLLTVPVHYPVHAIDYAAGLLIVAVSTGLLAIRLNSWSDRS
jgi:WD40 repeat protein